MFQYNSRISERYGEEVVSVAILTDERSSFRPSMYERSRWGFELRMRFPMVKLLDFEARRAELEASRNPFALVVLAHLDSRKARRSSPEMAFEAKWRLIRRLYSKGYERENVLRVLKFIDWVLRLPKVQEEALCDRVHTLEGKKTMPYVTSFERVAMERGMKAGEQKGLRDGLLEAIAVGLKLRFGPPGLELFSALGQVKDARRPAPVP